MRVRAHDTSLLSAAHCHLPAGYGWRGPCGLVPELCGGLPACRPLSFLHGLEFIAQLRYETYRTHKALSFARNPSNRRASIPRLL